MLGLSFKVKSQRLTHQLIGLLGPAPLRKKFIKTATNSMSWSTMVPHVSNPVELLLLLSMGHFLCDFSLQTEIMAVEKTRGLDKTLPWYWWLISHGAIHGLSVALLTGQASLGAAEWIAHCLIDFGKCNKRYNLITDQVLHFVCKVAWVALLPLFPAG
jgi:hypothetical protein